MYGSYNNVIFFKSHCLEKASYHSWISLWNYQNGLFFMSTSLLLIEVHHTPSKQPNLESLLLRSRKSAKKKAIPTLCADVRFNEIGHWPQPLSDKKQSCQCQACNRISCSKCNIGLFWYKSGIVLLNFIHILVLTRMFDISLMKSFFFFFFFF